MGLFLTHVQMCLTIIELNSSLASILYEKAWTIYGPRFFHDRLHYNHKIIFKPLSTLAFKVCFKGHNGHGCQFHPAISSLIFNQLIACYYFLSR
jgi:hypothetical protein